MNLGKTYEQQPTLRSAAFSPHCRLVVHEQAKIYPYEIANQRQAVLKMNKQSKIQIERNAQHCLFQTGGEIDDY